MPAPQRSCVARRRRALLLRAEARAVAGDRAVPLLLLGWALATLWFRETYPQRARGFAWVGLTFVQAVLLVVVVGIGVSLLLGR
ncbi:hypothetical protein [uncultured Deinococcus sp.]|uniref:hypothetical protein n=1 Tax=uncultured Deinococcus sp. TaxID=158789 RepID=UPI0025894706|nr:hypothetical protein [uncultured Deinococcus sp.]